MNTKISMMTPGTYPVRDYVPLAQQIENYGFDELHVADDLIMKPAWPILTLIGQHTNRITLGPAIVTPMIAHPVYHAANLVALDELTGGRAILWCRERWSEFNDWSEKTQKHHQYVTRDSAVNA